MWARERVNGPSAHNLGILAIWNDCAPGHETEYEAWYQGEHLFERLAVPGFLRGRRYESVSGPPQYFTYYETASPHVLTSAAYLERVNNPTPLTRKIMSGILTNMSRTVCRCIARHGIMRGAFAVTAKLNGQAADQDLKSLVRDLEQPIGVARAEAWISAEDNSLSASYEENLRGGDRKISACLFVEALRERDAQAIAMGIGRRLKSEETQTGIYRFMCELTNHDEARP